MELIFKKKALAGIDFWKKSGNKIIQNKISKILEDIDKHPYTGIGKPEALKYELAGYWSRRISLEDRIIYRVDEDNNTIYILSLKGHY